MLSSSSTRAADRGRIRTGLRARRPGNRLPSGVCAAICRPGWDMSLESLIAAFVTLFVIIDPVGIAPIFLALTGDRTPAQRRLVALRAVLIAAAVLILFALVGKWLLGAMGITLAAFRVAGGLLLFWISFEMVFEKRQQRKSTTAERSVAEEPHDDVAAVPLAVPLLAGPGAITAVILLAAPAGTDPVRLALVVGVVLAVLAATLAVLLVAMPLDRIMGKTVRMVVTRLLGVVLAALAVQFVADGVLALWAPA